MRSIVFMLYIVAHNSGRCVTWMYTTIYTRMIFKSIRPPSRSNQVAMESGSLQAEDIAFDSDNNMSLRVPIKNSIPTWVDNSSPFHIDFPLKDGLYLGA
jgi:hypothetical protein